MRLPALFVFAAVLAAQSPARLDYTCTDDDLQQIGLACSPKEPCPVYLELSGVESLGPKLFLSGNLHAGPSTLYSLLLASEDGGRTWTEPHPRIRNGALEQIQFLDFETGWVAGQIMQTAAPRDAFLLVTNDGGKTWRRVPIVEDEGRTGAIDRFWFTSKTSGVLLLDRIRGAANNARYELYESMTGGDNWSLREASSKPLQLKTPRPAASDWRIRPDAASKTYRLERRQGAQWSPLAAFPLRAGECVAKEPVFLDPEPEPEPEPAPALPPAPAKAKKRPTLERKRP